MVRYIIKRLFIGVVTIWALITITFFLIRIMPGSPFEADNLSQSAIEQLESTYGLDEPMWKQYILYMENLRHGSSGKRPADRLKGAGVFHGSTRHRSK